MRIGKREERVVGGVEGAAVVGPGVLADDPEGAAGVRRVVQAVLSTESGQGVGGRRQAARVV